MPKPRPRWTFPVAAFLGATLLRCMRATWRVDESPRGHVLARRAARTGGPGPVPGTVPGTVPGPAPGTVYVMWHSRILLGAATQAGLGVRVLISQHGDGEYIARTVERMGFGTVRGSSTRGGSRALLGFVEALEQGGDCALTPDGPKGPRLRVQPGCVAAASRTGAPIVPVGLDCRRRRRLASWDRFMVPWFFTKVAVRFGDEVRVPPGLDDAGVEEWCGRVRTALLAANAAAAAAVGVEPEPEPPAAPE